ncbi:MAG: TerB family tellurite resistance protein [Pseudomonadota bacterium]
MTDTKNQNQAADDLEERFFRSAKQAGLNESDIELAAAILMFEVIMSDGHVDHKEISKMVDILHKQFALDGNAIGDLLENVRSSSGGMLDLDEFVHKLKQYWVKEEHIRLLNNLWLIALADRRIDEREQQLIEHIAMELGLSSEEIQEAQSLAEQRLELKLS